MKPTPNPSAGAQPSWKSGTELRDDNTGLYCWPHASLVENPLEECTHFPSVTTVLDEFMGSGMRHAEHWFTAEYVTYLAECAKAKTKVQVWVDTDNVDGGETVEVDAIDVLLNRLPESFGKNFGKHWIKKAGPREMRKRANRGSVLHQALEDWAYGLRVDSNEVSDYTGQIIQGMGFTLTTDYCDQHVRQLLLWCDRYIKDVLMAEAVVMNRTYGYAGTLDTILQLRDYPELDAIGPNGMVDAKGSKSDQPSHELQGAAYFYAEEIGVPGTKDTVPMIELDWMANLYVQEDGVKLRHWPRITKCSDPNDCVPMRAFLHARVLWEAMYSDQHPKTMKPVAVRAVKPGEPGMPQKLADTLAQGTLDIPEGEAKPKRTKKAVAK